MIQKHSKVIKLASQIVLNILDYTYLHLVIQMYFDG